VFTTSKLAVLIVKNGLTNSLMEGLHSSYFVFTRQSYLNQLILSLFLECMRLLDKKSHLAQRTWTYISPRFRQDNL